MYYLFTELTKFVDKFCIKILLTLLNLTKTLKK